MERTTQLFTEFNERISKVCEEFADKVTSAEGPTEAEMAEHFKEFRSYIEQNTEPFWKEEKEYLDGSTGEDFISAMDMETALAAFDEAAMLIDDEATPYPLVEKLKSFGEPACELLLKKVLDASWQPEDGEDENEFFVKFQPCVSAIRFFGAAAASSAEAVPLTLRRLSVRTNTNTQENSFFIKKPPIQSKNERKKTRGSGGAREASGDPRFAGNAGQAYLIG